MKKSLLAALLCLAILPTAFAQEDDEEADMAKTREILEKPVATVQDLVDALLILNGEFGKYKTGVERAKRVDDLDIYDATDVEDPSLTPVTRGAISKAALNAYDHERGFFFFITRTEYYAFKDAVSLRIMDRGQTSGERVTGQQLFTSLEIAADLAESKSTWGTDENPYVDFGYDNYEEMSQAKSDDQPRLRESATQQEGAAVKDDKKKKEAKKPVEIKKAKTEKK